ncbi:hypothetical protein [Persephonella sp.]|nr:hypothetical protein [Persephonella sp.]
MNEELTYYLIIFLGIILGAGINVIVLTILNKTFGHKEKEG